MSQLPASLQARPDPFLVLTCETGDDLLGWLGETGKMKQKRYFAGIRHGVGIE